MYTLNLKTENGSFKKRLVEGSLEIVVQENNLPEDLQLNIATKAGALNYSDYINRLKKIPPQMQRMVLDDIFTIPEMEELQSLLGERIRDQRYNPFLTRNGITAIQKKLITIQDIKALEAKEEFRDYKHHAHYAYASNFSKLLTDAGLAALNAGILTGKILTVPGDLIDLLLSPKVMTALQDKLITEEQIIERYDETYRVSFFNSLLSENGILAMQEGLITYDDCIILGDKIHYFLENGIKALKAGVISLKQIKEIDFYTLSLLFREGINELLDGIIKIEQLANLGTYNLSLLLVPNGKLALRQNLITVEHVGQIKDYLELLLSNNGISALQNNLITLEKISSIEKKHLASLLSDNGIYALTNGLITFDQAIKIASFCKDPEPIIGSLLKYLLKDTRAIHALQEKLFTIDEVIELLTHYSERDITHCLNYVVLRNMYNHDNGVLVIREKLLTLEQIMAVYKQGNISPLLNEFGLEALRKHLITANDVLNFHPLKDGAEPNQRLKKLLTKNGLFALENKIISLETAKSATDYFIDQTLSDQSIIVFQGLVSRNGMFAMEKKSISTQTTEEMDTNASPSISSYELV